MRCRIALALTFSFAIIVSVLSRAHAAGCGNMYSQLDCENDDWTGDPIPGHCATWCCSMCGVPYGSDCVQFQTCQQADCATGVVIDETPRMPCSCSEANCGPQGGCSLTSACDEGCDSLDNDEDGYSDEYCQPLGGGGGGGGGCDEDSAPNYFATGKARSTIRRDFQLPSYDDVSVAFARRWVQEDRYRCAYSGSATQLSSYLDLTTCTGTGWRHLYDDQVIGTFSDWQPGQSPSIWFSWRGFDQIVKFTSITSCTTTTTDDPRSYCKSTAEAGRTPYELRYYGTQAGTPHIRIVDKNAAMVWEFEYNQAADSARQVAFLTGISRPAQVGVPASSSGNYYVSIVRDYAVTPGSTLARIHHIDDAEGRTLTFNYDPPGNDEGYYASKLLSITYNGTTLASFEYCTDGNCNADNIGITQLERVVYPDGSYERYRYERVASGAYHRVLLKQIIVSKEALSPARQSPAQSVETVLEEHTYRSDWKIKRTRSQAEEFGYAYSGGPPDGGTTWQYDLHAPKSVGGAPVACTFDADCQAGGTTEYGCWVLGSPTEGDGYCYAVRTITIPAETNGIYRVAGWSTSGSGGGASSMAYADPHHVSMHQDEAQVRTTMSYDPQGRPHCVVVNDDDGDAGAYPGACDPKPGNPSPSMVLRYAYPSQTQRQECRTSLLSTAEACTTFDEDSRRHVTSEAQVGNTRDLNGNVVSQTRKTTNEYDTLGRLVSRKKRRADDTIIEQTDYTYHPSGATLYDRYRLHQVRRYTSISPATYLTTSHSNYDMFGTAKTIIDEGGVETTLVTDARGRETQRTFGPSDVTNYTYNPDGSLRKVVDADGVCLTFDYKVAGANGVPAAVKRSSSTDNACGATPISASSGEVEVYTFEFNDPRRLTKVERFLAGVKKFERNFGYDHRQLRTKAYSAISPNPARTYGFDVMGLPTSDELENCPGSSCTKTTYAVESSPDPMPFGRRKREDRYVTDTTFVRTGFSYTKPEAFLPTTVTTGDGTTDSTTTTYVYNDFGEVVEFDSPNTMQLAGGTNFLTRFQYDEAGRQSQRKDLHASPMLPFTRTAFTHDALGRVLTVDYMADAVPNCSLPSPSVLYDEEYAYDTCPSPAPPGFYCTNLGGKMTAALVKLTCSSNNTYKRGTWFTYDAAGRLTQEIMADQVNNNTPANAVTTSYGYSLAGRINQINSPLTGVYGQRYALNPASGEVEDIHNTLNTDWMLDDILYEPFGPIRYNTAGPILYREVAYNLDYSLSTKRYRSVNQPDPPIGGFEYTRDVTGRVTYRNALWTGPVIDRHYKYDRIGRLACETTAAVGTCPISGGANLRANYAYHNGGGVGGPKPPDNRWTIHFTNGDQSTTGTNAYTYPPPPPGGGGMDILSSVSRGSSTLMYSSDSFGRRTQDDDTAFPGTTSGNRDHRTYTYLPNRRLATIQGFVPHEENCPSCIRGYYTYTLTFAYDHRGRPFNVTYSDSNPAAPYKKQYYLYWDTFDRLIAAKVVPNDTDPTTYHRWSYMSLDQEIVAGFLEEVTSGGTTVTKFWTQNDELGTPYQVVSETLGSLYLADFEGFGWRKVSTTWTGKWIPFALPGQLVFDETVVKGFQNSCWSSGSSCAILYARPPVHQNQQRDYDPYIGRYLELDPIDEMSRRERPAHFLYAANSPLMFTDPTGLWSTAGCTKEQIDSLSNAIDDAAMQIHGCGKRGPCPMRQLIYLQWDRKRWIDKLYVAKYKCWGDTRSQWGANGKECGWVGFDEWIFDEIVITDAGFGASQGKCMHSRCLTQLVAHESLHLVGYEDFTKSPLVPWLTSQCVQCK